MSNPLLFSEVSSESGAQASHHIIWGCISLVKSSVSAAAGWCSPAALSKRCLSWDKVVRQPQKKKYYQMWRAGQCGGCVWTRLITDTPVGRKDVKAVANPATIYGTEPVWFLASKSPAEVYGFDHTYTASTFVLNLGGKVSFAAVMRHFSWPTFHPSSTSSAMAEPIYVCMICCKFNWRLSLAIPYTPQFLQHCISFLRNYRKGLPSLPSVVNKSFIFDIWIIEHTTHYSQWR